MESGFPQMGDVTMKSFLKSCTALALALSIPGQAFAQLKEIGAAWKEIMGPNYPAMALVEVVRLVEPAAKGEIEATAVIPE